MTLDYPFQRTRRVYGRFTVVVGGDDGVVVQCRCGRYFTSTKSILEADAARCDCRPDGVNPPKPGARKKG